jgi:hypothetical protein
MKERGEGASEQCSKSKQLRSNTHPSLSFQFTKGHPVWGLEPLPHVPVQQKHATNGSCRKVLLIQAVALSPGDLYRCAVCSSARNCRTPRDCCLLRILFERRRRFAGDPSLRHNLQLSCKYRLYVFRRCQSSCVGPLPAAGYCEKAESCPSVARKATSSLSFFHSSSIPRSSTRLTAGLDTGALEVVPKPAFQTAFRGNCKHPMISFHTRRNLPTFPGRHEVFPPASPVV